MMNLSLKNWFRLWLQPYLRVLKKESTTWIYVVTTAQEKGIETTISNGLVSEYLFKGSVIYRFESTAQGSLGYDLEDSFYSNFDGTTLSDLITKR